MLDAALRVGLYVVIVFVALWGSLAFCVFAFIGFPKWVARKLAHRRRPITEPTPLALDPERPLTPGEWRNIVDRLTDANG